MELRKGMRVVIDSKDEMAYHGQPAFLMRSDDDSEYWWLYVVGHGYELEFHMSEFRPANVKVIEGEWDVSGEADVIYIDDKSLVDFADATRGKGVRITIEELD